MTFSTLKTKVLRRVIDLPPSVQLEVPDLINSAIKAAQQRYNFLAMEQSYTFTTIEGTFLIGTIPGFKEYRGRGPYFQNQHQKGSYLPIVIPSEFYKVELFNTTYKSRPAGILKLLNPVNNDSLFYVTPYPDALSDWDDGNYKIEIPHFYYTPSLVNDADTNWFVNNMEDYIVDHATGAAFALDWDYNSMALWQQMAENKFKEAKKADMTGRLSGVNTLVPFWRGDNQTRINR